MFILNCIYKFSRSHWSWLALLVSALGCELSALYFQHIQNLAPCVMCIYQRVAILGLFIAGCIGVINTQNNYLRILAMLVWAISAGYGVKLAITHVDMQFNPSSFTTCDFFVAFPDWLPLNQWAPWMFEATGTCSDIVWQLFGLSMPQWMVFIFAGYLVALVATIVSQILVRQHQQ